MKILDNGIDSLQKALKKLNIIEKVDKEKVEFELKDIIINLHHSIETLVKYLIREKNEYLIYEKLDKVFENERKESEAKKNTIQFMDAINRTMVLYDVKKNLQNYVSEEKLEEIERIQEKKKEPIDYYCEQLNKLNDLRNAITHNEIELNDFEILYLTSDIINFMVNIFKKNISGFNKYLEEMELNIDIKRMLQYDEFLMIKELFKYIVSIETSLDNLKSDKGKKEKVNNFKYMKCDVCNKDTFIETKSVFLGSEIIDSAGKCEYCGYEKTSEHVILKNIVNNYAILDIKENYIKENYIKEFVRRFVDFRKYNKDNKKINCIEKFRILQELFKENKKIFANCFREYLKLKLDFIPNKIEEMERIESEEKIDLCKIYEDDGEIYIYNTTAEYCLAEIIKYFEEIKIAIESYSKIFYKTNYNSECYYKIIADSDNTINSSIDEENNFNKTINFIEDRKKRGEEAYDKLYKIYKNNIKKDLDKIIENKVIEGQIRDKFLESFKMYDKLVNFKILDKYAIFKEVSMCEEPNVIIIECKVDARLEYDNNYYQGFIIDLKVKIGNSENNYELGELDLVLERLNFM